MLLRDFLNEFELDWAQAAVRSGQIPQRSLKGARILLAGDQMELQEAIAWSFMAWNDEKHSDVKVAGSDTGRWHTYGDAFVYCRAGYRRDGGLCDPDRPLLCAGAADTAGAAGISADVRCAG